MKRSILCLLLTVFAIFTSSQTVTVAQSSDELLIFAASSLTDAFTELSDQFEQENNVQVTLNFAGSSTLAAQLIQGAPANIFASANQEQMQTLIDDGLVDEDDISIFAENEPVIIVPADNPAMIESAEDLANDNIFLVIAAPSVPIREYTNQLLENLNPFYGDDYSELVLENVVSEESNVRQVTARVALGEADAGIVYRTDVTADIADDVQIIEAPEGTSPSASYPIAPLIESDNDGTTALFIEFVLSDAGQSILQEWGFCSPESSLLEATPEVEITMEADDSQEIETFC